jgi:beta-lactamase superfamily II metal-dependent hydrolase
MDKKTAIALIVLILAIGTAMYFLNIHIHKFNITFLNVGKADCSYITYEDKVILIDTGEEKDYELISRSLTQGHIDYLIITHFDKDHVGSASKIIDNYDIGTVYQTNLPKDNDEYNNYIESLNKKGITPVTVENDLELNIDKLNIIINGPNKVYEEESYNNSSLIVSVKYKNKSYLIMGDAMNERMEDYMLDHAGTYNIIKLPHHGDYLKQDEKLIEKYHAKGVVVSSDDMDKKLKKLIEDKHLDLYFTNESDAYRFKEF